MSDEASAKYCPYKNHPVFCGDDGVSRHQRWCWPKGHDNERQFCGKNWKDSDVRSIIEANRRDGHYDWYDSSKPIKKHSRFVVAKPSGQPQLPPDVDDTEVAVQMSLLPPALLDAERLQLTEDVPEQILLQESRRAAERLPLTPVTDSAVTEYREAVRGHQETERPELFLSYDEDEQLRFYPFSDADLANIERNVNEILARTGKEAERFVNPWLKAENSVGEVGLVYAPNFVLERRQAVWDFDPTDSSEVPIKEGETISVLERSSAGWWLVRTANGQVGLAPATYIAVCRIATTASKKDDPLKYDKDDTVMLMEDAASETGWKGWSNRSKGEISNLPPQLTSMGYPCDDLDDDEDFNQDNYFTDTEKRNMELEILAAIKEQEMREARETRMEKLRAKQSAQSSTFKQEQARMKEIEAGMRSTRKRIGVGAAPAAGLGDLVGDLLTDTGTVRAFGGGRAAGRAARWKRYLAK